MSMKKDLPKDLTSPEFLSGLGGVDRLESDPLSQLGKNQSLDGHEVGLSDGTCGLGHKAGEEPQKTSSSSQQTPPITTFGPQVEPHREGCALAQAEPQR